MVARRQTPGLYKGSFMRALLIFLVLVVALGASGITSAIASTVVEDDCCADGAGESPADEERDECPPLCHACACSPTFSVPSLEALATSDALVERDAASPRRSQLPASPPGRGVFHPPRTI